MNQEKQRIAIAEACRWKSELVGPVSGNRRYTTMPDYLNDLNAIHEAEMQIIYRDGPDSNLACDYRANLVIAANAGMMCSATAAQRAEAFLKTLGLWTEEE